MPEPIHLCRSGHVAVCGAPASQFVTCYGLDAAQTRQFVTCPARLAADREPAAPADLCVCGHSRASHGGHTHAAGTPAPTHCAQGCGCREFRAAATPTVEEAAIAVVREVDRAFEGSERLRVGKWLLPGEREQTIAAIIAAALRAARLAGREEAARAADGYANAVEAAAAIRALPPP